MAYSDNSGTKCVKITPTKPQGGGNAPKPGGAGHGAGPCPISEYKYGSKSL